jgi:hypothetical protein
MKAFIFTVVLFFLVISTQATTYYFRSGNAQTPGNWYTLTTLGIAATNFTTDGDIFNIPSGKVAIFSANCTFGSIAGSGTGVNLTIDGTATINTGISVTIASKNTGGSSSASSIQINGTLNFLGNSQLKINDDGTAVPTFTTSSTAIITTQNSGGLFSISASSTNSIITLAGSPTYTWSNGTSFEFNNNGAQILDGLPSSMKNLTFSGSGAKTMPASNIGISVNLTILTGVSAVLATSTNHTVSGSLYLGGVGKINGTYGGTSSSATYKNSTFFSGTGIITVSTSALPVTLTSFTAKPTTAGTVNLNWSTSTEIVNKGFRIERQSGSTNGKYETIGFVASKASNGNSQTDLYYNFTDNNAKRQATSYYRLAQVDLDGTTVYSEVRVVKLSGETVSMVFPNPSNGAVNISRTANGTKMNIQIIDIAGRMVQQINNSTDSNMRININKSGIYNIKMTYPETGEQSIQRVVIQK